MENTKKGIDLVKFILALFVIGIHTSVEGLFHGFMREIVHVILTLAVPYFFIASGYLLFSKVEFPVKSSQSRKIIFDYVKKIFYLYFVWSMIYLPLTVYGFAEGGELTIDRVITLIRNYLFVGEQYYSWTLWYLLALATAAFVCYLFFIRGLRPQMIVMIAVTLFLTGNLLEWLYSLDKDLFIVNLYFDVFKTTRNGVFIGLLYLSMGMIFAYKEIHMRNKCLLLLLCILGLAVIKVELVRTLLLPVPAALLFLISLELKFEKADFSLLRKFSMRIYLIHMYWVAIYNLSSKNATLIGRFCFVSIISIFSCFLLEWYENYNPKLLKRIFG